MRGWFMVLLLLFGANASYATPPIVYNKAVIEIIPRITLPKEEATSEENTEKNAKETPQKENAPAKTAGFSLSVEIRASQIPADQGMFVNYALNENNGLMTYFGVEDTHALIPENIGGAVDVLFIRKDGVITQIVPDLYVSSLAENMLADSPVIAFLFLQAGLAEKWQLSPGDLVKHGLFTPKPKVQKIEEN